MFLDLHVHSCYSLLDGINSPEDIVKQSKEYGRPGVAITDHASTAGLIPLVKACKKHEVKPILGCEFYVTPSLQEKNKIRQHLIIIATNQKGLETLLYLDYIASKPDHFYYRPRLVLEDITDPEGLIASPACVGGFRTKEELERLYAIFGDNLVMELMAHVEDPEVYKMELEDGLVRLDFAKEHNLLVTATSDAHYILKEMAPVHDIALCINVNDKLSNPKRWSFKPSYWLRSDEEMLANIEQAHGVEARELVEKSQPQIFERIESLEFPKVEFEPPPRDELLKRTGELLDPERRKLMEDPKYAERFSYEMGSMLENKLLHFILMNAELVNWARENDIAVGPGRGSAAGSLVCYMLNITQIDPLKYGLLFERFISPTRKAKPDIDLDFESAKRDEVIKHIYETYPSAACGAFSKMHNKGVIRDLARVMELSESFVQAAIGALPLDEDGKEVEDYDDAIKEPAFQAIMAQYPDVHTAIKYLNGCVRHETKHASGIVTGPIKLAGCLPMKVDNKDKKTVVVRAEYKDVEALGWFKFDILGLKMLDTLKTAEKLAEVKLPIDIDSDPAVTKLLVAGETAGVFQLEGWKMRELLEKLQPQNIAEIATLIALYRPGPFRCGMTDRYLAGGVQYTFEPFNELLKETRGVAVFQEQIMQLALAAGISASDTDDFRRAIGWMDAELVKPHIEKFKTLWLEKGAPLNELEMISEQVVSASGYGYNRAHATSYAQLGFWSAWMKAHYPAAFYTALLQHEFDEDKLARIKEEMEKRKVKLLPPSVNEGDIHASMKDKKTVFLGLSTIKGVGATAAKELMKHRPFVDADDIRARVQAQKCNIRVIQALVKARAIPAGVSALPGLQWLAKKFNWQLAMENNVVKVNGVEWTKLVQDENARKTMLATLQEEVKNCKACKLREGCTQTVFGAGSFFPEIVFVGEAPGENEDKEGVPFIGQAGQLLRSAISAALPTYQVYITNIVRCFVEPSLKVFTSRGWTAIKDITVGDLVLSHKGRFRRVVSLLEEHPKYVWESRKWEVVKLVLNGGQTRKVTVTPEHKFLTQDGWVEAKNIKVGMKLARMTSLCGNCGQTFDDKTLEQNECNSCRAQRISQDPRVREKLKSNMTEQYKSGQRDRFENTKQANTFVRKQVCDGTHMFLKKNLTSELIAKRDATFREPVRCLRVSRGIRKEIANNPKRMSEQAKRGAKALRKFHKTHPGKSAVLAMRKRKNCMQLLDGQFVSNKLEFRFAGGLIERGIKFKTMKTIGGFVPDFLIGQVIVEVDGSYYHLSDEQKMYDKKRDAQLEKLGFTVLRFSEQRIQDSLECCLDEVEAVLKNHEGLYTLDFSRVVLEVEHSVLKQPRRLWDISVEGDESFVISPGTLVSHNCRPPDNRTPSINEMKKCGKFVDLELALLNPRLIVSLGGTALRHFTGQTVMMANVGKVQKLTIEGQEKMLYPLPHPSYLNMQGRARDMERYLRELANLLKAGRL